MNSKRVQKLISRYKAIHPDAKMPRNLIWSELAYEYNTIFEAKYLSKVDTYYKEDFRQFIYLDMLEQINKYDLGNDKKCSFDTFFYWRLKSVRDRFMQAVRPLHDNHIEKVTTTLNYPKEAKSPDGLYNYSLDIKKILTSEEYLLYLAYSSNKYINWTKRIDVILEKIQQYLMN